MSLMHMIQNRMQFLLRKVLKKVLQKRRCTVPLNFPNAALGEDKIMSLEEVQ